MLAEEYTPGQSWTQVIKGKSAHHCPVKGVLRIHVLTLGPKKRVGKLNDLHSLLIKLTLVACSIAIEYLLEIHIRFPWCIYLISFQAFLDVKIHLR